ncbi:MULTISPECIES: peptidoglycan -binding protein [unclassified Sulfitobacter]|uniref:peptidoglycan -binding protein n=1 Tax=Sulfitobacter TaxID=60136 RepID=UPI000066A510|nr:MULTISPECIES: peptidoglycan -binding protein [unclassified Sulfitobacter]AXI51850.1 flagellar motor protein [Sulfitobacter sp. SK025]EAP81850.1 flagellar motor protein [Sulfitobacter sp. NAS-14.1]
MALSRRTGARFQGSIWPGFVDAMTGLLLVLMFVLTIFMVLQAVQTQRINGQENELNSLSGEVAALAQALGMERQTTAELEAELGTLNTSLTAARDQAAEQAAMIASLTATRDAQAAQLDAAEAKITGFEAQVASLLSQRDAAVARGEALETRQEELLSAQEALNLALAQARSETDAQAEAARLAAARRDALTALVDDLRAQNEDAQAALETAAAQNAAALSEAEAARLAEAAAAERLREKLENADAELTAMTLALETQRQEAEDTLTLLAAARAAKETLDAELAAALAETETLEATQADRAELRAKLADALAAKLAAENRAEAELSDAEKQAALLDAARSKLAQEEAATAAAQRQTELLNQQVAALRGQLGELQSLLDDAVARDAAKEVQLQSLGSDLNTALARVAAEERRRAELEAAERARLEAETKNLEQYRSEFFGRLRALLGNQEGVRIEGDRFVFSSEVLFPPGAATLSADGRGEIAKVAGILRNIAADIPPEIDWVIRVDGHTDNQPLSGLGEFADNWELSQARALSVVKYMINFLGIAPERLAANGFGQYQPVASGNTEAARAQNRRIELKLTER